MSVRIENFSIKSGKILFDLFGDVREINLYDFYGSNCFLSATVECDGYVNLMWDLVFFDEKDMKSALGLEKGKENLLAGKIKRVTLYKNTCRNWKKIITMFAQAFDSIDIEIRSDAE